MGATRYTNAVAEQVAEIVREKGTLAAAGRDLGIKYRTLTNWMQKHPAFAELVDAAREQVDGEIFYQILKAARAGDLDTGRWILTRPGRMFHKGKRQIEHSGKIENQQPLQLVISDPDGYARAIVGDPE